MAGRTWSTGICGCTENFKNAIESVCCPHCMLNRQYASLEGEADKALGAMCFLSCIGFHYCLNCNLRCKVAQHEHIEEGCCGSCCMVWFCSSCSLCQTWRELQHSQPASAKPGGWCSVMETPSVDNMPKN